MLTTTAVQRAIWWNTALWTAGHALTSGAFLSYFAVDLEASGLELALLAAAPELVGCSGLVSGSVWRIVGERRRAWLLTTIIARFFTLCIPLAAMTQELPGVSAASLLLLLVIVSQSFQGIATALYFGWLADLAPPSGWGRLFAGRNIAALLVQMTVPVAGALFRDAAKSSLPSEQLWWAYAAVMATGVALLMISLVPMLRVHDPAPTIPTTSRSNGRILSSLLQRPGVRQCLACSWVLALANGFTQAAFFKYQIAVVGLSLTGYFLLADLMFVGQIVASRVAGRCTTTADHRRVLFWSTLITSCALPFWLLADAGGWWWLIGAFACWGAFGAVNVAGPNLMLSFSQPGEHVAALALFRQVAGTLAGLSGIVGGALLDALSTADAGARLHAPWSAFAAIFALSWIGRVAAAGLVLAVPRSSDQVEGDSVTASGTRHKGL